MPIIEYTTQGADDVIAALQKQVNAIQKLIGEIVACNGDAQKMTDTFKAFIMTSEKNVVTSQKSSKAIRDEVNALQSAIRHVAQYQSETDKLSQKQENLLNSLIKIEAALGHVRKAEFQNETELNHLISTEEKFIKILQVGETGLQKLQRSIDATTAAEKREEMETIALNEIFQKSTQYAEQFATKEEKLRDKIREANSHLSALNQILNIHLQAEIRTKEGATAWNKELYRIESQIKNVKTSVNGWTNEIIRESTTVQSAMEAQKRYNATLIEHQKTIQNTISSVAQYASSFKKAGDAYLSAEQSLRLLANERIKLENIIKNGQGTAEDAKRLRELKTASDNARESVRMTALELFRQSGAGLQATEAMIRYNATLKEHQTLIQNSIASVSQYASSYRKAGEAYSKAKDHLSLLNGERNKLEKMIAAGKGLPEDTKRLRELKVALDNALNGLRLTREEMYRFSAAGQLAKAAIEAELDAQKRVTTIIERSISPIQRLNQTLKTLHNDYRSGTITTEQYIAAIRQIKIELKQYDTTLREHQTLIQNSIASVSQYASSYRKAAEAYFSALQNLKTLNSERRRLEQIIAQGKGLPEDTKRLRELKAATDNARNGVRLTREEMNRFSESGRKAAIEAGLFAEAQQRVTTILERSISPTQRLMQSLKTLHNDYRNGAITTKQYAAALKQIGIELTAIQNKANSAGTGLNRMNTVLNTVRSTAMSIAGAFGVGGGIAGGIMIAQQNLQRFADQLEALRNVNMDVGKTWRTFANELAVPDVEELVRLREIVVKNSLEHGYSETLGAEVALAALKTSGTTGSKIPEEQVLEIADTLSSYYRHDKSKAIETVRGVIDVAKQFKPGEMTTLDVIGIMEYVNTQSRTNNMPEAAQSFPRLLAYYMSTGMESKRATAAAIADFSYITQAGVDPSGHITTYALITQAAKKQEFIKQIQSGEMASEWIEDNNGNLSPVKDSEKIDFKGVDISKLKDADIETITRFLNSNPEFRDIFEKVKVVGGRSSTGVVRLKGAFAQAPEPENMKVRENTYNEAYTFLNEETKYGTGFSKMPGAELEFENRLPEYELVKQDENIKRQIQEAAKQRPELNLYQTQFNAFRNALLRSWWTLGTGISPIEALLRFRSGAYFSGDIDDESMQRLDEYARLGIQQIGGFEKSPSQEDVRTMIDVQRLRQQMSEQFGTTIRPFDREGGDLTHNVIKLVNSDSKISEAEKKILKDWAAVDPNYEQLEKSASNENLRWSIAPELLKLIQQFREEKKIQIPNAPENTPDGYIDTDVPAISPKKGKTAVIPPMKGRSRGISSESDILADNIIDEEERKFLTNAPTATLKRFQKNVEGKTGDAASLLRELLVEIIKDRDKSEIDRQEAKRKAEDDAKQNKELSAVLNQLSESVAALSEVLPLMDDLQRNNIELARQQLALRASSIGA